EGEYSATVVPVASPGHTMGSTMFLVEGAALLTGDTLFLDGVGRPDLAERAAEFAENLFHSIHVHTDELNDDVIILPAHVGEAVDVQPDVVVQASLGQLRWRLVPLTM
ncbi:MAG: MBL fold metallo-hydrolase, partial [Actinomycetota bacterium]